MIRFGPGGNSEKFYEEGFKSSVDMPAWLSQKGLTAYEYQCNKGVKVGEKMARELGKKAKENNILLSIHAPYYINMASEEERIKTNSKRHLIESLKAAEFMGAERVVFHSGSLGKSSRAEAMGRAKVLMEEVVREIYELNLFNNTFICPELMGKINQLGDLDEIIEFCLLDERILPAIDFGHLYARNQGSVSSEEDFYNVLDIMENKIGREKLNKMHIHFSKIEFSKGGEKRHLNFDNQEFGPNFIYLAKAMKRKAIEPVIICESMTNMVEDALYMKEVYENL